MPECFDAARAQFPTRVVGLAQVVDLLPVTHAPERIAEYQAAMLRGERFPPIAVVRVGRRFLVADGHKRLSAYRQIADEPIAVEVWSVARWLRDQREQLVRKTRQQASLLRRSHRDPHARQEARRLALDTLGHWRRIALSARAGLARGSTARAGDGEASPWHLFLRLVGECLAFPGRLAIAVFSLIMVSGAQLYLTWLVKRWADGPLQGDASAVAGLMLAGTLTTAVMVGAVFVSRYALNSVNQRMVQHLRDAALARILALQLPAAQRWRSGELVSRMMNDAGLLSGFVRDLLKRLLGEGLLIVGALSMALYLDWRLALAIAAIVPLVALLLARMGSVIRRRGASAQAEIGDLGGTLNEQLRGLTTIKGFDAEDFERRRFADQNRRYRRAVMRGEWWSALLVTGVWIVTGLGLWGILWFGTRQVVSGQLTPGGLMAFLLYVLQTLEPMRRLSDVQGLLQRALAAAQRVYEVIDCDAVERGGDAELAAPRGVVRYAAVDFAYRADTPVLRGVSLRLDPGVPTALVAASGGGKSTLAKLLVRFADPQSGAIGLDGADLRGLSLTALRRAVCLVEQEPFLFSGRLIDNLRYGAWETPVQRIDAAVGLAGLQPLVAALPAGLDTLLAEGGRDLSVGQKQRIALARAIVRDPRVLVLDEATSALDSDSERQIFAQLDGWLRQRTTLVIAHRLSSISRFDRVIVLEDGRVVGDGSIAALLADCPPFARLFNDQIDVLATAV
jgi:ATP-binding cassette, subfamily B, bacterial MsbA